MSFLDLIFPKYCVNCRKIGTYLCSNCFSYLSFDTYGLCLVCGRPSINQLTHPVCKGRYTINGVFSAIVYKGVARKLIYNFKYKPYLSDLNKVLGDLFYESVIQQEGFSRILEERAVLAPIPLHSSKLRSRGYNHARILAEELAKRFKIPVIDLLIRVKKTAPQVGLKRKERIKNLEGAFSVLPNILISQYPNIFLVDDILTTGSTLLEAAKTLRKAGVKNVWGLALAQD